MAHSTLEAEERGRRVRRAAALSVVALVLAAQVAAIGLGTGGKLWPFLRYAMYAQTGDTTFSRRTLCVRTATGAVTVDESAVALPYRRFSGLVQGAVGEGPEADAARELISRLVERHVRPHEALEIWRRTYIVGPEGLVDSRPPWELERAWRAAPADPIEGSGATEIGALAPLPAGMCP